MPGLRATHQYDTLGRMPEPIIIWGQTCQLGILLVDEPVVDSPNLTPDPFQAVFSLCRVVRHHSGHPILPKTMDCIRTESPTTPSASCCPQSKSAYKAPSSAVTHARQAARVLMRASSHPHAAQYRSHGLRMTTSGCAIRSASPSGSVKLHNPVGSPGRVVFCAIPVRSVSTTISPNLDMICYALGGGRRIPVNSPRVSFG